MEFDASAQQTKAYWSLLGLKDALTDPNHPESDKVFAVIFTHLQGNLAILAEGFDNAARLWTALTDLCTKEHTNNQSRNMAAWALFEYKPDETLMDGYTRLLRLQIHPVGRASEALWSHLH